MNKLVIAITFLLIGSTVASNPDITFPSTLTYHNNMAVFNPVTARSIQSGSFGFRKPITFPQPWESPISSQVLGTSQRFIGPQLPPGGLPQNYTPTGNTGGQPTEKPSGSPDGGTNYAQRMADLAEQQRRSRIDSTKMQGKNLRDSGQRTFDDLLKSIGSFRERAGTLKQNAGQEIIDTASNILGSNAATAQDLASKATGRARGLGLGLSSRINLGNDVLRQLQSTQGNTVAERGQQERANDAQFQERQDQAQDQENTANTYRKGINDQATTLENMGYSKGEDDFSGALNNIVNYQQQMAQLQPLQAGGIQGYQPDFSGIANTLNGVLSGMEGGGQSQAQDFANPVGPTNYLELLRQRGLVR